ILLSLVWRILHFHRTKQRHLPPFNHVGAALVAARQTHFHSFRYCREKYRVVSKALLRMLHPLS
ncbi:MAG: hypothetical protein PVF83_18645, partial [Anaerolineales bacterium]